MMYLCFMNKKVFIEDLGFKDYKDTWEYQEELFKGILDLKVQNRRENSEIPTPNYFLYVEHPPCLYVG